MGIVLRFTTNKIQRVDGPRLEAMWRVSSAPTLHGWWGQCLYSALVYYLIPVSRKRVELALCTDGFEATDTGLRPQNFSLVLLQCLLLALYLIVLSVRYRIQFGRGRFCLIFLAMRVFFAKVFIEPISSIYFYINNKSALPFSFPSYIFSPYKNRLT